MLSRNCRDWFYFPIEMPVTSAGWGPATVGLDADKITYCVWDKLFNEHGSFDNLYDAINGAMRLNHEDQHSPTGKGETMTVDLTPEAVERLAADLDLARKVMFDMGTFETGQVICKEAAATLRALSERLAELEAANVSMQTALEEERDMSDYYIESATKEEWAERTIRAENKLKQALDIACELSVCVEYDYHGNVVGRDVAKAMLELDYLLASK
jgi:hypothetical protein